MKRETGNVSGTRDKDFEGGVIGAIQATVNPAVEPPSEVGRSCDAAGMAVEVRHDKGVITTHQGICHLQIHRGSTEHGGIARMRAADAPHVLVWRPTAIMHLDVVFELDSSFA